MSIGRERHSYKAAVEGEAPPPPEPLMEVVRDREGWRGKWSHALKLLYNSSEESLGNAAHAKYRSQQSAWDYIQSITDSDAEHHDYMRAVVYKAKQSTRFWGVRDDEEERYCSRCRQVKDRDDFSNGRFYCDACS